MFFKKDFKRLEYKDFYVKALVNLFHDEKYSISTELKIKGYAVIYKNYNGENLYKKEADEKLKYFLNQNDENRKIIGENLPVLFFKENIKNFYKSLEDEENQEYSNLGFKDKMYKYSDKIISYLNYDVLDNFDKQRELIQKSIPLLQKMANCYCILSHYGHLECSLPESEEDKKKELDVRNKLKFKIKDGFCVYSYDGKGLSCSKLPSYLKQDFFDKDNYRNNFTFMQFLVSRFFNYNYNIELDEINLSINKDFFNLLKKTMEAGVDISKIKYEDYLDEKSIFYHMANELIIKEVEVSKKDEENIILYKEDKVKDDIINLLKAIKEEFALRAELVFKDNNEKEFNEEKIEEQNDLNFLINKLGDNINQIDNLNLKEEKFEQLKYNGKKIIKEYRLFRKEESKNKKKIGIGKQEHLNKKANEPTIKEAKINIFNENKTNIIDFLKNPACVLKKNKIKDCMLLSSFSILYGFIFYKIVMKVIENDYSYCSYFFEKFLLKNNIKEVTIGTKCVYIFSLFAISFFSSSVLFHGFKNLSYFYNKKYKKHNLDF
jgi:hypothetical protein